MRLHLGHGDDLLKQKRLALPAWLLRCGRGSCRSVPLLRPSLRSARMRITGATRGWFRAGREPRTVGLSNAASVLHSPAYAGTQFHARSLAFPPRRHPAVPLAASCSHQNRRASPATDHPPRGLGCWVPKSSRMAKTNASKTQCARTGFSLRSIVRGHGTVPGCHLLDDSRTGIHQGLTPKLSTRHWKSVLATHHRFSAPVRRMPRPGGTETAHPSEGAAHTPPRRVVHRMDE
jgi:hypothetical protein